MIVNCPLTPALLLLLKTCVVLSTTDAKALAAHLHLAPCTVRNEFQLILNVLDVHHRHEAVKLAKESGWLSTSTQIKAEEDD